MADVAEEDWITAVTPVPSSIPFHEVLVSLYSSSSSRFPAAFFNPSPMRDMPNRNSATPHNSVMTLDRPRGTASYLTAKHTEVYSYYIRTKLPTNTSYHKAVETARKTFRQNDGNRRSFFVSFSPFSGNLPRTPGVYAL